MANEPVVPADRYREIVRRVGNGVNISSPDLGRSMFGDDPKSLRIRISGGSPQQRAEAERLLREYDQRRR